MQITSAQPYEYDLPENSASLALLIIGMQRGLIEPGGFGSLMGNDVTSIQSVVPMVKRLLDSFRALQLPIFYIVEAHQPDLSDCPPSKQKRMRGGVNIGDQGALGRILVLGEPGTAIVAELAPLPGEPVLAKPGKGAFFASGLEELLPEKGITHLIVAGITTEVGVQTTMREANDRGYECLLVEDATESYNPEFKQICLEMIRAQGGIVGWTATADQVIQSLEAWKS
jgi:nicotinamidase-related amidase